MVEKIKLKNVDHISIIVKDVDKTVERISSTFETPEIKVIEDTSIASLGGKEIGRYRAKAAMIPIANNLKLEIVQIVEGKSAEQKWLKEHGETVHHIGIETENLGEEASKWKKKGAKVIQEDHGRWICLDTEKTIGTMVELYKPGVQAMFL